MSLPVAGRFGAAVPRLHSAPPYVSTVGGEVADFMAQVGKPGLSWQTAVIGDAFGVRDDGKWAAREVCVLEARQNGKGWITEAQELGGLYLLRERKIIHSAHLFDTSREAFKRLIDI